MATTRKRINVTIDDETYEALEKLSRIRARSISSVSFSLLQEALELQEDLYFSRIADQRLSGKEQRISHQKAWE
ncbi:MAG: toxin-antitoxin system, antitoxin component [Acidobacteriota bacterium]